MASVKANVVANFSGKAITGLVLLVLTPIYVRLLGIESYGLVGMFAAIQGMFGVMDLGLGATLNQRLAALSAGSRPDAHQEMRDLVRTFEIIYSLIGLLSGLIVVVSAPLIAHYLLHASALPQSSVDDAVRLMGVALALQWPVSLYSGALAGTQRQVLWNVISVSVSMFRSVGAVAALLLLRRTVGVFFGWQILMAVANTIVCHFAVWLTLPKGNGSAHFRRGLVRQSVRFATHLAASSLLAVIITQIDKFLLGYWLPLTDLGYYTLATTVSSALYNLIGPVFTATFPRLSQLVSAGRIVEVRSLYHKACQLMSLIIFPPAAVAAVFAYPLLLAWTGNPETTLHTQMLVPFLVMGTALNGTVNIPYALQLAYGWSRFGFMQNVLSALVITPLIVILIHFFGALGASLGWLALNAGYVLVGIPIMHRRLLVGDYPKWLLRDVTPPLLAALAAVGTARFVIPVPDDRTLTFVVLSAIGGMAVLAAALSTPFGRATMRSLRDWLLRKQPQMST